MDDLDIHDPETDQRISATKYLLDLAERLMAIPVMYGTDQRDATILQQIANALKEPIP